MRSEREPASKVMAVGSRVEVLVGFEKEPAEAGTREGRGAECSRGRVAARQHALTGAAALWVVFGEELSTKVMAMSAKDGVRVRLERGASETGAGGRRAQRLEREGGRGRGGDAA